ncbi:MAG: universal stress protein [Candidatus Thorarchaeota archaeon]
MGTIDDAVLMPVSGQIEYSDMVAAMLPLLKFQTNHITLLHVIEAPISTPLESSGMEEIFSDAEKKVQPLQNWLNKQGYVAEIKLVTARDVSSAIAEEAGTSKYSMIFMMKRRRKKGILGLFSKSVTENVIRNVDCPVITILV